MDQQKKPYSETSTLHHSPEEFELLKKQVYALLGFNTLQYKDSYLKRRFNARLRMLHLSDYQAYLEVLKRDKEEQERLLRDLTINVTEFFRDNTVYRVFQEEVLPKILNQKPGRIHIWSAGCSDGKEAYSIAMIAVKQLGEEEASKRIDILATDIDKECIQKGICGVYESRPGITQTDIEKQLLFIGTPHRFFDIQDNIYKVKPSIRRLVKFQYHDLISGPKKKGFDIIFCRNVVIYFKKELQERLFMDYYNALNPGGFFIMGKTETLVGKARELFIPYNSKERVFIKDH